MSTLKTIGKAIKSPLFKQVGNSMKKPIATTFGNTMKRSVNMFRHNTNSVKKLAFGVQNK